MIINPSIIPFLLAVISALLSVISFPPFNLSYLAWIAFVTLFISIKNQKLKKTFLLGFVQGCFFYAALFYGLISYSWLVFLATLVYLSLFTAIFSLLTTFLQARLKHFHGVIPPVIWTSLEFLKTIGPFSFPTSIGVSQYQSISLIQMATVTGIYGISFWIILINSYVAECLQDFLHKGKVSIRNIITLSLIIFLTTGIMLYGSKRESLPNSLSFSTSIIQGSIPVWLYQIAPYDPKYSQIVENTYSELTKGSVKRKPQIIVWPETNLGVFIREDEKWKEKIRQFAYEGTSYIILGTPTKDKEGNQYNSALVFSPKGKIIGQYDKVNLVPFAEQRFKAGREIKPISSPIGKLGVVICYESVYPSISRKLIQEGASFLIILTNDAWFKKTPVAYLHAVSAVFRAVENRSYVIRAAQSGISMIIDPYGNILEKTLLFVPGALKGVVKLREKTTLYSRFGDLFSCCCLLGTFILLAFSLWQR
ncbi:MAG: apolipoprotein N-acyltransferase [bacterium]